MDYLIYFLYPLKGTKIEFITILQMRPLRLMNLKDPSPGSQSRYSKEEGYWNPALMTLWRLCSLLNTTAGVWGRMSELLVRPQTTNRDNQGQAGPGAYQVLPHSQLLSCLLASLFLLQSKVQRKRLHTFQTSQGGWALTSPEEKRPVTSAPRKAPPRDRLSPGSPHRALLEPLPSLFCWGFPEVWGKFQGVRIQHYSPTSLQHPTHVLLDHTQIQPLFGGV